ncbi:MAG TPA: hypothetical protein VFR90_06170 [Methylibium sp.]|nr:hypothetical protein [Methylibium sp.]HEU4458691.1 hypothetical protein [Methylibium sp.]
MNLRPSMTRPAFAIGAAALWGAIEFVALARARWARRAPRRLKPG